MSNDENNYVVCGRDLAELKPTAELRWERRIEPMDLYSYKVLQQKWVASAKMPDGGIWEEHRWRDVAIVDAADFPLPRSNQSQQLKDTP